MRVPHVVVFLVLTVVSLTHCEAVSTDSERPKVSPPHASLWSSSAIEPKRALRIHNARHAEADAQKVSKNDEERVGVLSLLGQALIKVKAKGDQQWWLFRKYTPDQVQIILNLGKEDEKYKEYVKYFYSYFIKYFDEPLAHFPEPVIEQIWKARLRAWLDTDSPPLVFEKLGLKGSPFASAKGQKNYKHFQKFHDMWTKKQMRESQPVKLDIVM
ncbi:hypothetical protein PHYPSEUDO_003195 [Phytophthora pseudosyringae]|uniref:RxLR effector protein n=1 Tax=Phytophthora pseudosyringae TaxID=221518 RepID=A0A8T1VVE6_9STRA|nr:hypothetical protein PHYPSEUDO_003195 [Phytophthora pseudosyringae]